MKILDCTLRDGGYYTNWDFDSSLIEIYIKAFNQLPANYLEIGYRSNNKSGYFGEYFYTPIYVIDRIREMSNKQLAVLIDEKDVLPEHIDNLLDPCRGKIALVRIALDPQNIVSALKLADRIKAKGFEVALNAMYMSKWNQYHHFINELSNLKELIDYLYMVDSYGGIYPEDVRQITQLVKEKTNTALGFHGHNNLELALANTLTALDCGVQMIDATVTGMGRGAGNLKTELFFTVIQKKTGCDIDFNALSNLVDRFEILRKNHEWGTNLPYMVSGANSLPQKEVMELVTKRFYSMNSIIHALQTKMGISIRSDLRSFKPQVSFDKVIIVGGGANAQLHSDAISRLLDNNQEYCLIHASSKNAKFYRNLKVKQYFCLVGNEGYRLEKVFNDFRTVDGDCILPPPPRVMGTYIPSTFSEFSYELPSITFTNRIFDSHTVLALQTSLMLDAKEVGLVGYDGYNEGLITQHERAISEENEYLFQDFQKNTRIRLFSLTTTNYRSLSIESLYSKFI